MKHFIVPFLAGAFLNTVAIANDDDPNRSLSALPRGIHIKIIQELKREVPREGDYGSIDLESIRSFALVNRSCAASVREFFAQEKLIVTYAPPYRRLLKFTSRVIGHIKEQLALVAQTKGDTLVSLVPFRTRKGTYMLSDVVKEDIARFYKHHHDVLTFCQKADMRMLNEAEIKSRYFMYVVNDLIYEQYELSTFAFFIRNNLAYWARKYPETSSCLYMMMGKDHMLIEQLFESYSDSKEEHSWRNTFFPLTRSQVQQLCDEGALPPIPEDNPALGS